MQAKVKIIHRSTHTPWQVLHCGPALLLKQVKLQTGSPWTRSEFLDPQRNLDSDACEGRDIGLTIGLQPL